MYNNTFITRKCSCCDERFVIDLNNISDAIYFERKTYHLNCFTDICNKRSKRKNTSQKWSEVLNNIENIKKDSSKHLMSSLDREGISNFIKYNYDVTIVPSKIWQKISDISSGNYFGLDGHGIPMSHLLDMWERKMDLLNSIASNNITKGKTMNTFQRISYDLSVLINKYDSYLKWLEKKRINDIENEVNKSDLLISKNMIAKNISNNKDCIDSDDISDLVDDIFS